MELLTPDPLLVFWSLVLPLALAIVALVIYFRRPPETRFDRIGWFLVILLIPYLGILVYLAFGRKRRPSINKTNGIFQ
jgi:hypothetical protein